ncbi:MAG: EAL domain-containing protein [Lachnospiraceae bacterium]|nr:EAL domain-containing protein [Lachnospiraceae bacterium]
MEKMLTGMKKRNMEDFLDKLIIEHEAEAYVAVSFNIRGMGNINAQVGLESGTALMRAYVDGLSKIIAPDGIVVRADGATFSALFRKEKLDEVINYLKRTEVETQDGNLRRSISSHAGYYILTDKCRTYKELVGILEEALRAARSHVDSNLYAFCDDEILKKISEAKRIESMFRDAVDNEEFMVFYQPKVETKHYRLKGAEALCRWMHDGEMILPFRFIPVYEHSGDIVELDFYMIDHVCRDIRRWLDEGREVVRVSINLSREHLGDKNLVEEIVQIVDKNRVPHEYIEIELTETSTEVDYVELKDIVKRLHEAGIRTSIDDFGVGYSSMNLLLELPWDMVKIDRSFVPLGTEDEEDKKRLIMMRSIVSMALALDIECIAEGVETVQQMLLLKENGCFFIQGYYFDRPLPVEEFEERLDVLTEIRQAQ